MNGGERMKNKRLEIRLTQGELDTISRKAGSAGLTNSAFIIKACMGKQIFVVEGINELARQHRAIGNNINQLTHLANAGQIQLVDMGPFLSEYEKQSRAINELLERKRWR